jgi:hypothetical protein
MQTITTPDIYKDIKATIQTTDKGDVLITGVAILSYPALFEPKARSEDKPDDKVYSCQLVFPADQAENIKVVQQAYINAGMRDLGKEKFAKLSKSSSFKRGLRDGQEKDWPAGFMFLNASTKFKPQILDHLRQEIKDPARVEPGYWVRAIIKPYGFEKAGAAGVAAGLNSIQILGPSGLKLGGSKDYTDAFSEVALPAAALEEDVYG